MNRKTRNTPPSPEFPPAASSAASDHHHRRRHRRRKMPKQNVHTDDESEQYEDEQSMNPDERSYESESVNKQILSPIPNSGSNSPIFSSYINIAPLPIFRGERGECPVTHLSRFAKFCRANNVLSIKMLLNIFPVTLENEAALWYDLNVDPYSPPLTWEEIKNLFAEAYRSNDINDDFRSELTTLTQGDEEPVRSYFLRLQWILKKWPENGIPEALLKGVFIDGLRDEFKDWMIPQKPESLDEALRMAFDWEKVRRSIKMEVKCGFCDESGHEEWGCEIRAKLKELWLKGTLEKKELGSQRENEGDLKEEEREKKKSECQCWKHQCGKRRLERNNSVVTAKF